MATQMPTMRRAADTANSCAQARARPPRAHRIQGPGGGRRGGQRGRASARRAQQRRTVLQQRADGGVGQLRGRVRAAVHVQLHARAPAARAALRRWPRGRLRRARPARRAGGSAAHAARRGMLPPLRGLSRARSATPATDTGLPAPVLKLGVQRQLDFARSRPAGPNCCCGRSRSRALPVPLQQAETAAPSRTRGCRRAWAAAPGRPARRRPSRAWGRARSRPHQSPPPRTPGARPTAAAARPPRRTGRPGALRSARLHGRPPSQWAASPYMLTRRSFLLAFSVNVSPRLSKEHGPPQHTPHSHTCQAD